MTSRSCGWVVRQRFDPRAEVLADGGQLQGLFAGEIGNAEAAADVQRAHGRGRVA